MITGDEVRASGASDANDAIRKLLGLPYRTDLRGGRDYTLDLRGFGATADQNVVVVIDGIRVSENELTGARLSAIAPEMIERKPELAKWEKGQPGGPTNPLGARALYLTTNGIDYGYRIHGTPEWQSIGSNASSGCIRMINQDIIDLYGRVPDGAKVVVLTRDGQVPKGLTLPPPAPKKVAKAVAPAPEIPPAAVPDRTIPDAGPV